MRTTRRPRSSRWRASLRRPATTSHRREISTKRCDGCRCGWSALQPCSRPRSARRVIAHEQSSPVPTTRSALPWRLGIATRRSPLDRSGQRAYTPRKRSASHFAGSLRRASPRPSSRSPTSRRPDDVTERVSTARSAAEQTHPLSESTSRAQAGSSTCTSSWSASTVPSRRRIVARTKPTSSASHWSPSLGVSPATSVRRSSNAM
jgi:hypothetical protein